MNVTPIMDYSGQVKDFLSHKVPLSGIADLDALVKKYPDLFDNIGVMYPRAVSVAVPLSRGVLDTIEDRPNILYFSHYRQVNYLLDRITLALSAFIEEQGFRAVPVSASQYVGRDENGYHTGHICHRRIAWQAGLGSIGRNNLLVTPPFGAAVRISSVLTDMDLEADEPIEGVCDNCGRCREQCPAGAIGMEPDDFDLNRCFNQLEEFRKIQYIGQHICGVCISACRGERT